MLVHITITGTKPLLMHNVQLANPDNVWAKKIAAIAKKRKKTEDDRIEMSRLEFQGSLYVEKNKVVMPTANVLKCLINTAKITKEGKTVSRALSPTELNVPLIYDGPETAAELLEMPDFFDQTVVGIQNKKVVRTRPVFTKWGLGMTFELLPNVLDFESLARLASLAGRAEGLGDNRINGWGRFEAEVDQMEGEIKKKRAA